MIGVELAAARVTVRLKSESKLMRFLAVFLSSRFMTHQWTTVSARNIWAPVGTRLDQLDVYATIIRHELVHTRQARLRGLWQLAYVLLPVPVLFAWCRWWSERRAYLVNIRAGTMTCEQVADVLWRYYAWPWPKSLMLRWLRKQVML